MPDIERKRWSLEKEYFALEGEKFTISWVTSRHLCFGLVYVLMMASVIEQALFIVLFNC